MAPMKMRLQETSEGIASNEADLAAATEVRGKAGALWMSLGPSISADTNLISMC